MTSPSNKGIAKAIEIAKDIVQGRKNANDGCSELGEINRELDWPEELAPFGLLAHEQYDHENIGITAEGCVPEIIDECKKLIEKYS